MICLVLNVQCYEMVFLKAMPGINKYLDCLFSLDNTFENYMIDKFCSRGYSIGMMKEAVGCILRICYYTTLFHHDVVAKENTKKQNLTKLN